MGELAELGRIAKGLPSYLRQQAKMPYAERSRTAKYVQSRIDMNQEGRRASVALERGKDARAGRYIGRGLRSKDKYAQRINDQYDERDKLREWRVGIDRIMGPEAANRVYGPHLRTSRTLAELGRSINGELGRGRAV